MSPRTTFDAIILVALLVCAGMWSRSCDREAEARGEAKAAKTEREAKVDSLLAADSVRRAHEGELQEKVRTAEAAKDSLATAARAQDSRRQQEQDAATRAAAVTAGQLQALRTVAQPYPVVTAALDRFLEADSVEKGHAAAALSAANARGDGLELALMQATAAKTATDSLYQNERAERERAQLAVNAALVEINALRGAVPGRFHELVRQAEQVALPVAAAVGGWKARCILRTCEK